MKEDAAKKIPRREDTSQIIPFGSSAGYQNAATFMAPCMKSVMVR